MIVSAWRFFMQSCCPSGSGPEGAVAAAAHTASKVLRTSEIGGADISFKCRREEKDRMMNDDECVC